MSNYNNYIQSFVLVSDEIENRVWDAMNGECANDYSNFDLIDSLVNQFCLDYPQESAYYHREVIESVFESKANALLMESFRACEARSAYGIEDFELYAEGVQLEMF